MGHIRLGVLPKSRKWRQVVDEQGAGAREGESKCSTASHAAAEHNEQHRERDV